MPINSRQKGKRGEREFCKFMRSHGYTARRGQQYSGGEDSPDVIVTRLPLVHFEVKYGVKGMDIDTELFTRAKLQTRRDAGDKIPVIAWKPLRKNWRFTVWLHNLQVWGTLHCDDFFNLIEQKIGDYE